MRVLLVDDHYLFAEGLKNLLSSRGVEVVGVAGNGEEALKQTRQLQPDLILLDVYMPGLSGIETLGLIKRELPEVKIVMLTYSAKDENLFEAVRRGACGYLLKNLRAEELFAFLEQIKKGEPAFSPGLVARLLTEFARREDPRTSEVIRGNKSPIPSLTPRQSKILELVATGMSYNKIAKTLSISERTVKYHMEQIMANLHLGCKAEAMAYAVRKLDKDL